MFNNEIQQNLKIENTYKSFELGLVQKVFSVWLSDNHVGNNNVSDNSTASAACSIALTNNMQESSIYTEEENQCYDDLMLEELAIDTLSQIKVKTIDGQDTNMITGNNYKIQKKIEESYNIPMISSIMITDCVSWSRPKKTVGISG